MKGSEVKKEESRDWAEALITYISSALYTSTSTALAVKRKEKQSSGGAARSVDKIVRSFEVSCRSSPSPSMAVHRSTATPRSSQPQALLPFLDFDRQSTTSTLHGIMKVEGLCVGASITSSRPPISQCRHVHVSKWQLDKDK